MWSQEIALVSQFFGVSNWCSSLNVVVRKCGNIRKCTRKQTSAQGWSLKIMVKPNLEFLSEPTQSEFVAPLQLQSFTDPKKLGRSKALLFPVSSFAIQPRESSAKSPNIPGDFGPKIFQKIKGGKKTNGATHQWVGSQTRCTKDLWNVRMFRRDNVTKPTGEIQRFHGIKCATNSLPCKGGWKKNRCSLVLENTCIKKMCTIILSYASRYIKTSYSWFVDRTVTS